MSVPKNLPCFAGASREEAMELLWKWEYGCPLPLPDQLEFREVRQEEGALAGKAVHRWMEAEARWKEGSFTFPFHVMCPKAQAPVPGVVLLNFTPAVPDFYLPSEELCDLGWRWPPSATRTCPRTMGTSGPSWGRPSPSTGAAWTLPAS